MSWKDIVRAKNMYVNEGKPKTNTFYYTGMILEDKTKDMFKVFQRGKTEFFVDIPLSDNELGLIYKGYFTPITCKGNMFDLGTKKRVKGKVAEYILGMNIKFEMDEMISRFKAKYE